LAVHAKVFCNLYHAPSTIGGKIHLRPTFAALKDFFYGLLVFLCVASEKEASLERKVEILDKFSLSDSEIATICGSAKQSIRNARHNVGKHGKKNKKRR
jgi:hypothetical protein